MRKSKMEDVLPAGILLEGYYTLTQAAQVLEIDNKTLQKRLASTGIKPVSSPHDRRLRLLSEEQVQQLRGTLDRVAKSPRAEMPMGETIMMIKALARRVAKIEGLLSRRASEEERLQRDIDTRMRELEQTTRLLALLAEHFGVHEVERTRQDERGLRGASDSYGGSAFHEGSGREARSTATLLLELNEAVRTAEQSDVSANDSSPEEEEISGGRIK